MNYKEYSIAGKNKDTNRKRTLKIKAISEEMAEKTALDQGLLPPLEMKVIPFRSPSESQLNYANNLGIEIPDGATSEDVSCLIDIKVSHDSDPNPELLDFAENRNMFFSYYIGKRRLYKLIFYTLEDIDKTAFFIFSIYRWLSEDRHADLDTHPNKCTFYEFAESVKDDKAFQKSLLKYEGEDLRFFGKITIDKDDGISECYGGSDKTIAYKKAAEFLRNEFDTPLTRTKTFINGHPQSTDNAIGNINKSASTGCLLPILVFISIIVFIII